MPYKDKQKKREYQNLWMKKRRLAWICEKGGKCVYCGSQEDLHLDHIRPMTKFTHRLWSLSKKRRDEELSLCQVLCRSCQYLKVATWNKLMQMGNGGHIDNCVCAVCVGMRRAAKRRAERPEALVLEA